MTAGYWARVNDAHMSDRGGDVSTSPEALQILTSRGVDAWQVWVAQRRNPTPAVKPFE